MRRIQLGACFSVILALAGCSDSDEPLDETGGSNLGGSDDTGGRSEETGGRTTGGRDEGGADPTGGREPTTGGADPTGGVGGGGGGQVSTGGAGTGGDVPVIPGCDDPLIQAVLDYSGIEVGGAGGGGGAAPGVDGAAYETIQAAVDAALPGSTVHICAGTHDVGGEPVSIDKPLRVMGAGSSTTTVENGGFDVKAYGSVSISDLTITSSEHAVTCYYTELDLSSVVLTGNEATEAGSFGPFSTGAGLQAVACQVELVGSTVSGNAAEMGAGIFAYGSSLSLQGSMVEGNQAQCMGGGIAVFAAGLQIQSSTVTGNEAGLAPRPDPDSEDSDPCYNDYYRLGGGVVVFAAGEGEGGFLMTGSTVSDNTVDGQAGGIALLGVTKYGNATIANSTISGNAATGGAGGLLLSDKYGGPETGTLSVVSSTVSGNTAGGTLPGAPEGYSLGGGGLMLWGGHTELIATSVSGNRTEGQGGGILLLGEGEASYYDEGPTTSLSITTDPASGPAVSANEAAYGGGIRILSQGEGSGSVGVSLVSATVSGNKAAADGGGISVAKYGTGVTVDGVLAHIDGNEARGHGAGFHLAEQYTQVSLNLSTVSGNTAGIEGGGFWTSGSDILLERTEVTGNAATRSSSRGGAFFATDKYANIELEDCTVTGNRAGDGGGAFLEDSDVESPYGFSTARLDSSGTVWGESDTPEDNETADVGFNYPGLVDYETTGEPDFTCTARFGCGDGEGEGPIPVDEVN